MTTDRAAQVVVIGGGIVGSACAYALARRGADVAVLERDSIAAGTSGACDGHVTVQTKAPGYHVDLARRSLQLYRELPGGFAEETEFRANGSMLVAENAVEAAALEEHVESRSEAGLDITMLTGARARQLEPALAEQILCASHCPSDGQANPWRITQWFAGKAAEAGARIMPGVDVHELMPGSDGVRLHTSAGTWHCQRAVVAAGTWTPQLLDALAPTCIEPRRGEILVTERLPRVVNGLVLSAGYLAKKHGTGPAPRATLALEQSLRGNLLVGATRDFVGYDRRVTAEGTSALAACATRIIPKLAQAHIIRSFAGLRPYTPDGLPLIGPLADFPSIVVAAGHEGDGITLAPVTAQLVAEAICDGASPDARLSASRFA